MVIKDRGYCACYPCFRSYRGIVNAMKGQHDLAITDFNKALEINPKDAGAYYNRGCAYAKIHEYDKALDDIYIEHKVWVIRVIQNLSKPSVE